jgi:hypothetical protein
MNRIKNFSFPYTNFVLIFSAVMFFLPFIIMYVIIHISLTLVKNHTGILRLILLIPTFFAVIGFIYCILGFHVKTIRGDELKLRIHLESLNVAFTASLISLFILIFIFLNFSPAMLNWLLVFIAIIAIVSYVIGMEFIKQKYQ